jgi:hypothetical protein
LIWNIQQKIFKPRTGFRIEEFSYPAGCFDGKNTEKELPAIENSHAGSLKDD